MFCYGAFLKLPLGGEPGITDCYNAERSMRSKAAPHRRGLQTLRAVARRPSHGMSLASGPPRPDLTPPSMGAGPPGRRRLATLFVDIAESTSLLVHHPPEVVLGVVQGFMTLVTEVTSAHAGTVKDFEGDGALMYFGSTKNAVRAALAIQRRLADGRCDVACGDGPGIAARMSVTRGDVVVGTVGSATRRGMALVGPSVNIGARLLKHAQPGTIIAGGEVFAELRRDAPQLASAFHPLDAAFMVPGADGMTVATYVVPRLPLVAASSEQFHCSPGSIGQSSAMTEMATE
jgi:class 3 adenylate cyclase